MALEKQKHPTVRNSLGHFAFGGDCLRANVNGNWMNGFFFPVGSGLTISVNSGRTNHPIDGFTSMITFREKEVNASFECMYGGRGQGFGAMKEALGIQGSSTANWRWRLDPGMRWMFQVDKNTSPRGLVANNSLFEFLNLEFFLDNNSVMTMAPNNFWRLSLRMFRIPESVIMNRSRGYQMRDARTGRVIEGFGRGRTFLGGGTAPGNPAIRGPGNNPIIRGPGSNPRIR